MHDELGLGQIITTQQQRDAVHIAVIPLMATSQLNPSEHIGVTDGDPPKSIQYSAFPIGIVDPFLKLPVKNKQMFWLYLYPGSITSLRHDWTHPALKPLSHNAIETATVVKKAELWLRDLAVRTNITYENLVEGAVDGSGVRFSDEDGPDEVYSNQDKFWECIEIVSGKSFGASHREDTTFRCAC